MADSLDWVLSYHARTAAKTVSCDIATREQPGAEFANFWDRRFMWFTVSLMTPSAGDGAVDRFRISVDDRPALVRPANSTERQKNILYLRGSEHQILVGGKQLSIRAFYSNGGHQDLTIDLNGFSALYLRALRLDCIPPRKIKERCQYWTERRSRRNLRVPPECRPFVKPDTDWTRDGRGK